MLAPGDRVESVLEEPAIVGEPLEMIEHRLADIRGGGDAAGCHAATLAGIRGQASSRVWAAMTGQSMCGAVARAAAAILAITSRRVITERSAAAMAAGSRCGTS